MEHSGNSAVQRLTDTPGRELPFPVELIPFLGRRDDIDIRVRLSFHVICTRRDRLSRPDSTPQDAAVLHFRHGLDLVWVETRLRQFRPPERLSGPLLGALRVRLKRYDMGHRW